MMSFEYRNVYSFTWSIENFSFCNEENGRFLNRCFIDGNVSGQEWFLTLYPRGLNRESSNFISCFLQLHKNDIKKSFQYGFKIEIIGGSGKKLKTYSAKTILQTTQKEFEWGKSKFLEIKQLMQDIENSGKDTLTICCYVYGNNSEKEVFDGYAERTKVTINRLTYRWQINQAVGPFFDKMLTLQKNTNFRITVSKMYNPLKINIFKLNSFLTKGHFVMCKLAMLDKKGFKICSEKATHLFGSEYEVWNFSLGVISGELNSKLYDDVTFSFEFLCSSGYTISLPVNDINVYSNLQQDLLNMFLNKKCSDIKLHVGNHVIEAHKTVLTARSPEFSAMFDQDLSEARTGVVDIVDIDANTLSLFLQFLYSDTVSEMDFEQVKSLLLAAEKYKVVSLKSRCSEILNAQKSLENVCEVLSVADIICDSELKSSAINFIIANSEKVLSSPFWLSWVKDNMTLASQIFLELTYSDNRSDSSLQQK